jgi:hypothetical protein
MDHGRRAFAFGVGDGQRAMIGASLGGVACRQRQRLGIALLLLLLLSHRRAFLRRDCGGV